jgi:hypothetical protein
VSQLEWIRVEYSCSLLDKVESVNHGFGENINKRTTPAKV